MKEFHFLSNRIFKMLEGNQFSDVPIRSSIRHASVKINANSRLGYCFPSTEWMSEEKN